MRVSTMIVRGINIRKTRWSYNNVFKTLKSYAMDYMGNMAINARCIGAPENAIEDVSLDTNMYNIAEEWIHFLYWDKRFKEQDNWYLSEEIRKMESLGIMQSQDSSSYWIASRNISIEDETRGTKFFVKLNYVDTSGTVTNWHLFGVAYNKTSDLLIYSLISRKCGFRPIFILRDDIKVEKTGHLN